MKKHETNGPELARHAFVFRNLIYKAHLDQDGKTPNSSGAWLYEDYSTPNYTNAQDIFYFTCILHTYERLE